jgi:hypothetical protein
MLAIMVDLGWPWWVTTLIAAGIALLAAWVFVRTRRSANRAVSALVLFEAIAVAVIAPFVMDSSDKKRGTSAMGSGSSGAVFAQRADANCSALYAYIGTLGSPKTPAGIERQMDRLLPEFWRKIVAQGELAPPQNQQATTRQWMHAMTAFGRDYELLRAAASRRDAKGMSRANASANAHAAEAAGLSKKLGLRVCFQ